ncbi:hypothetical protein [Pseudomonas fluorescens]|uniref:Uncharacterized protein n=1 Tax=Pseudomonas fluorescens TaxID=294 RepID=A0A0F4VDU4_PSEFL|nr:hypothetical protein [Pseudomonas fluorescens]KJZ66700.1 hypothetical protein VD17_06470 [Pseudomonas fluorescens]
MIGLVRNTRPSAFHVHYFLPYRVGAAEGCDLLIFGALEGATDQKIAAFGSSYIDIASGMPEKLSNNRHGKKEAGTVARLLFACPFQGMNE